MTPDDAPERVRRFVVEGRVQGVGFRWFVRERARRWGVAGWVQNRPDGAVELAVAGTDSVVTQFMDEIRVGPKGADVRAVRDVENSDAGPLPFPFTIRR